MQLSRVLDGRQAELAAQALAGAVQAGADGAGRHAQRAGDPGAVQVRPGQQQQHLALLGGQVGDGQRGTTRRRSSVDPLGDAVADIRSGGVGHDAGIGAQPPLLGAGVLAQQVPGDPVQPGGDVGTLGLIPVTLPERQGERLGGKVVGQLGADPPPQVAMNRRVVPVEQLREASGLDQRRGDQLGVVRGGLLIIRVPSPSQWPKRPAAFRCPPPALIWTSTQDPPLPADGTRTFPIREHHPAVGAARGRPLQPAGVQHEGLLDGPYSPGTG